MSNTPDGGYEGHEREDDEEKRVRLEWAEHYANRMEERRAAILYINDDSRGVLFLSYREYEYIKRNIEGEIPQTTGSQ